MTRTWLMFKLLCIESIVEALFGAVDAHDLAGGVLRHVLRHDDVRPEAAADAERQGGHLADESDSCVNVSGHDACLFPAHAVHLTIIGECSSRSLRATKRAPTSLHIGQRATLMPSYVFHP